jgi:hypothetical protein
MQRFSPDPYELQRLVPNKVTFPFLRYSKPPDQILERFAFAHEGLSDLPRQFPQQALFLDFPWDKPLYQQVRICKGILRPSVMIGLLY